MTLNHSNTFFFSLEIHRLIFALQLSEQNLNVPRNCWEKSTKTELINSCWMRPTEISYVRNCTYETLEQKTSTRTQYPYVLKIENLERIILTWSWNSQQARSARRWWPCSSLSVHNTVLTLSDVLKRQLRHYESDNGHCDLVPRRITWYTLR